MRGESSANSFFKAFPRLIRNCYQGAKTSTSEGVQKIFDKAKRDYKGSTDNMISMIYFDELGLAELSEHNPLKVLHKELEYDENDKNRVAFVGISNWTLDASKMNRGLYLSIVDFDEADLIDTAKVIADSYQNNLSITKGNLISALAKTYYQYTQNSKENQEFNPTKF